MGRRSLHHRVVTHSGQAIPRLAAVADTASLDPARLLPPVLGADDTDTPADIVDALALPPGATVLRRAAEPDRDACLAAGDGWTIRVVRWHSGGAEVSVTAVPEDLA